MLRRRRLWTGFIAGVFPFAYASVVFYRRIAYQRRCEVCGGSGLVNKGGYMRKCVACGGLFPWQSWRKFFLSGFTNPGNGGWLRRPSSRYEEMQAQARRGELDTTPVTSETQVDRDTGKITDSTSDATRRDP